MLNRVGSGSAMAVISTARVTVADVNDDVNPRCTRAGCTRAGNGQISPDLCDEHHEDQKRRQRECMARKREKWDAEKLCTRCGGVRYQGRVWCRMCLRSLGRIESGDVNTDVDKAARVAAATRVDVTVEKSGTKRRVRFHGQGKRGRRAGSDIDREDLADCEKALRLGTEGMAYAAQLDKADPSVRIPKVQRDDVKAQALARLVEAGRWIAEVVRRHGYEVPVMIVDDEED